MHWFRTNQSDASYLAQADTENAYLRDFVIDLPADGLGYISWAAPVIEPARSVRTNGQFWHLECALFQLCIYRAAGRKQCELEAPGRRMCLSHVRRVNTRRDLLRVTLARVGHRVSASAVC